MVMTKPKASDFQKWTKLQSQSKIKSLPKLPEMKIVRFLRGSNLFYYKRSHSENEFQQMDFRKKTANIKLLQNLFASFLGVYQLKKSAILLLNCAGYMRTSRKRFSGEIEEAEDVQVLLISS